MLNEMSMSDWGKLTNEGKLATAPCILTDNGEPKMLVDMIDAVIPISDLHPRIQAQMRGLEMTGRGGKRSPVKIYTEQVRQKLAAQKEQEQPVA